MTRKSKYWRHARQEARAHKRAVKAQKRRTTHRKSFTPAVEQTGFPRVLWLDPRIWQPRQREAERALRRAAGE